MVFMSTVIQIYLLKLCGMQKPIQKKLIIYSLPVTKILDKIKYLMKRTV
jgi:hypothetical protein